jgi:uncharacterized membrane protein
MNHPRLAATALSAAIGLALVISAAPVLAQDGVVKQNKERMAKGHLEKCFAVNAVAKNDCAQGAHSCAGQATQARDPGSFVLLPAGDCGKIAGGKTTAS